MIHYSRYMYNYGMLRILANSGCNLRSFRQGIDNHTLNALKHSEWVLICIEVLCPGEAVCQFLNVTVVGGNALRYLGLGVSGMLYY